MAFGYSAARALFICVAAACGHEAIAQPAEPAIRQTCAGREVDAKVFCPAISVGDDAVWSVLLTNDSVKDVRTVEVVMSVVRSRNGVGSLPDLEEPLGGVITLAPGSSQVVSFPLSWSLIAPHSNLVDALSFNVFWEVLETGEKGTDGCSTSVSPPVPPVLTGPASAVVYRSYPCSISFTNTTVIGLTNVRLVIDAASSVVHGGDFQSLQIDVGTLAPGQSVTHQFDVSPHMHGELGLTAIAFADQCSGGTSSAFLPFEASPCPSDLNMNGVHDPDDLGDFLNAYFDPFHDHPLCDFNADAEFTPDDLGDFLNEYFGGCGEQ